MQGPSVRERVLEASLVCIGRYGLARTTVDGVAQAAGVSRATIYRHFPGGRDQIVKDTDRNHWMTADEAKNYGLVDEIIEKRR